MAEAIRRPLPAAPVIARSSVRIGALPGAPAHVGTMLGLSVAGYGVALALVTGLQASNEAAVNADRAPIAATIDGIAARHDQLGRGLEDAASRYDAAAARYQAVADGLAGVEDRLATLGASVKAVDGASKALPASVALPPVVRSVRVSATPTTGHATTGGSAVP
jgi:hypothetical protein